MGHRGEQGSAQALEKCGKDKYVQSLITDFDVAHETREDHRILQIQFFR